MTLDERDRVVVIVASVEDRADVGSSLQGFLDEVRGQGRVLLLDGTNDGTGRRLAREFPEVQVISCRPGSLAPELWGEGIRASSEPFFVLTTSQMRPTPGWLDALCERLSIAACAGVGGPIEPAKRLSALDRAVYLLRYVSYHRPFAATAFPGPPGDNAIYRRETLPGLSAGFWETEIHRVLREGGEQLGFEPDATVLFHGGGRLRSILFQRFLHGWHYGSGRASRFGVGQRLARTLAAPLVLCVLLIRIVSRLREKPLTQQSWLSAFPWLLPLLASWTLGELIGIWRAPPERHREPSRGAVGRPAMVHVQE